MIAIFSTFFYFPGSPRTAACWRLPCTTCRSATPPSATTCSYCACAERASPTPSSSSGPTRSSASWSPSSAPSSRTLRYTGERELYNFIFILFSCECAVTVKKKCKSRAEGKARGRRRFKKEGRNPSIFLRGYFCQSCSSNIV